MANTQPFSGSPCAFTILLQATFHQRIKVYQNWQSAQATLTKKREALVKLELAGKQEKIPPAQEEVKEVRQLTASFTCIIM